MPIRIQIKNDDHFRAALLAMLGGQAAPLLPEMTTGQPPSQLEVVLLDLDFRYSPERGIEGHFRLEGGWQNFQKIEDEANLTPREREVLNALARGLSYKMTADKLGISIGTLRTHVKRIYQKLKVHSVTEAVARAFLR